MTIQQPHLVNRWEVTLEDHYIKWERNRGFGRVRSRMEQQQNSIVHARISFNSLSNYIIFLSTYQSIKFICLERALLYLISRKSSVIKILQKQFLILGLRFAAEAHKDYGRKKKTLSYKYE